MCLVQLMHYLCHSFLSILNQLFENVFLVNYKNYLMTKIQFIYIFLPIIIDWLHIISLEVYIMATSVTIVVELYNKVYHLPVLSI